MFTPLYRSGSGPPLVLLHGFLDTWRTWELVLPALERRHEVLALALPGHAGGPPLAEGDDLIDAVERLLDEAGVEDAHLAGNSLGGWVALQLAARGRARSVVALAPGGGWMHPGEDAGEVLDTQASLHRAVRVAAARADVIVATREGRRRATRLITTRYEHIPAELLAHQMRGVAACDAMAMVERARRADWTLDAARITCPVRIVWGHDDVLLPWPDAAERYRTEWLPHADWVELDGVGHCPQLDVPLETAQLILGTTASSGARRA